MTLLARTYSVAYWVKVEKSGFYPASKTSVSRYSTMQRSIARAGWRFRQESRDRQCACEGKVVVTIDMRESCLLLYPLPEWEVVQRKLEDLSNINPQARLCSVC